MTNLRAARLRSGLDIEEAANRVSVTVSYLAKLERQGSGALTFARAQKMARAYGVSMSALIGQHKSDQETRPAVFAAQRARGSVMKPDRKVTKNGS